MTAEAAELPAPNDVREDRSQVCVVGAGPAGLTLALLLLRSGVRVTVVERSRSQQRAFRGEIIQPGAMRILDRLGVLEGARARGCHEHSRFRLVEGERVLLDIDYRALPAPYDHLLSLPQAHLLTELLLKCEEFPHFRYVEGCRVNGLLRDGQGRITGVSADGHTFRTEVVVAADGRFSKVRRLAGIEAGRTEAFDQDVLWFKLRRTTPDTGHDVRVFRSGGTSPVLSYGSWPDSVQVGWTLPHQGYKAVVAQGLGHVKEQLAKAVPAYAELIDEQITSLRDLSLLDVFSGRAERWADDGLVLIGDAAHTHSPIGAQGINLAVQDAVVLHPLLVEAVGRGDASAAFLSRFEERRSPDIATMMRIQGLQSKAMLSTGTFATRVRPKLAGVVRHTPLYGKVLRTIAFGNPSVTVAEELFAA
ncbi:FAD-dependent monooxygenase [Streptomyces sp. RKAG290]|uniref:FAD-dependent monooxygenase n=1 Tax=Streptomyces sp. RKAG290 TaxID=2888348 RepID=UPI0020333CBC|nr:FAD-dependent monooxygenase [Streptomyces sp. RKAG290]MCM2414173.1 FAD-dependent monooxygenase [Streptomyces sp. RKAG290]